jgi:hypothetical protein
VNRLGATGAALAALLAARWTSATPTRAATVAERNHAVARILEETLRREAAEGVADRRELLQPALAQAPNHQAARWHSGFVFDARHRQWLAFEEAPQAFSDDDRLARYRRKRGQYPRTVDGQLALARWCLHEKLVGQARAHLSQVLELNPDHMEARRLLGFRLINGQWVEEQELAKAAARHRRSHAALRQWKPRLEEIRKGLGSGSRRVRQAARAKLMAIDDPGAVGAVEQVLCSRGGELALLGVNKLENMKLHQAAEALTWQAVFSPWGPIRRAAAMALRSHRKHDYVPLLLSAMDTPVKSRSQIYESLDGRLLYRQILYHEDAEQRQIAVVDKPYLHRVQAAHVRLQTPMEEKAVAARNRQARLQSEAEHEYVMNAFRQDAIIKAQQRETAVARRNQVVNRLNDRLCYALSTSLGDRRFRTPQQWWDWWSDYNELYVPPQKPVRPSYLRAKSEVVASPYVTVSAPPPRTRFPPGWRPGRVSCLAGDTIVWTELGPTPIQDVRPGDRVFSCDVDTGCLALKPVLKTTVRPKVDLLKVETDGERIEATGGHAFWVAGTGWIKARELEPGMRLHTITGTARVESVEDSGPQEPRNLVVADFHTYFAGEGRILTHDNTMRQPTNAVVPGLAAASAAVRRNDVIGAATVPPGS